LIYVKTKGKRLNRHARNERLKACHSCNDLNTSSSRCKVCGCFVRLKSWLPMEKCPNGKWSPVS
jgi:hypothetical protein